jgi:hypothetical protein
MNRDRLSLEKFGKRFEQLSDSQQGEIIDEEDDLKERG